MTITNFEAIRLVEFAVFCFLRQNGYSEENVTKAQEFAKKEFIAFCEEEGIEGIELF